MKANELTLGSWVKVDDMIYQVYQIFEEEVGVYENEPIDRVEPIPLTAEILEGNGFVAEGNIFKMWTSADKRVLLNNNDGYINSLNKWHVHVDTEDMRAIGNIELTYVHQLQQFLRLCGMNELADNFKIQE